jgi:hypothetical protein
MSDQNDQLENAIQKSIRKLSGEQRQTLADVLRRALIELDSAESVIGEGDTGVEALADFLNEHLSRPLEDLTLMVEAAMDEIEEQDEDRDDDEFDDEPKS